MSYLYNKIRNEILQDHKSHDFRSAYQMPLTDKVDLSKHEKAEYKKIAKALTDDDAFPYEVICWVQESTIKMGYRPL